MAVETIRSTFLHLVSSVDAADSAFWAAVFVLPVAVLLVVVIALIVYATSEPTHEQNKED
jgi:hypothetical protein